MHIFRTGFTGNVEKNAGYESSKMFLFTVYLIVFSAFFDTHAQMPVLSPYAQSVGASSFMLGVVVGVYSLFNVAGNFAGGMLIDQKGWKLPLFIGLCSVVAILWLYTLVGGTGHLVLVRAAHGFMGGILVPAALSGLIGNGEKIALQRRRVALFGATVGFAAVTGPMAAGLIANHFGYHAVYYSLAGLMFIAVTASFILLSGYPIGNNPKSFSTISVSRLSSDPKLRGALVFALGTMGSTGTLATYLPLRAGFLGFDHAQTGMLFATFALTAIVVQMIWNRYLRSILKGDCRSCVAGQLCLALALSLAALSPSAGSLYAALFIFGLGFGLSFQGMLGLVIEGSQPDWQGRAIGLFFAFYSIGAAVVPPLSGLAWQYVPVLFPFYTAAAATLAALYFGKRTVEKKSYFNAG